jgi:hypothetical protein
LSSSFFLSTAAPFALGPRLFCDDLDDDTAVCLWVHLLRFVLLLLLL